jgi:asparagine synthase (glutamine-hydrolysing)
MCRIAGIISKQLDQQQVEDRVYKMCQAMHKGGPDGEGIRNFASLGVTFGHRRLSLIDLSDNGAQPMGCDENIWITFNGEIYNYQELKADLINQGHTFSNETDTEVILIGYKAHGTSFFNQLSGMFAFALLDKSIGKTFLVRDSAGIKPLYFSNSNGELYFASEVKAFTAAANDWTQNQDWKIYFLTFGFIPEPFTTLKNVYSLPKGHYICWTHQTAHLQLLKFSDDTIEQKNISKEIAEIEIKKQLDRAVKRHLIADAPIGVFLSGGIDSSLLSLIASQQHAGKIKTISINFNESDFSESHYQNLIAKKIDSEHVSKIVTAEDFQENIDQIFSDMDQPSNDGINSWFVNKIAYENGLKAVLSGIGADELFGGYPSFKRHKLIKTLKLFPKPLLRASKFLPGEKLKRISFLAYKNPIGEYLFLRGFYTAKTVSKLLGINTQKIHSLLESFDTNPVLDSLKAEDKISWFEMNVYMQNQLLKDTDYMSMAHGVEVRVPFLDKDLIHTAISLPKNQRFRTISKGLLIDAYHDMLPKEIWDRPKKGFTFPFQKWFSRYEPILNEKHYKKNPEALKLLNQFKGGNLHWSKIFAVYQIFQHEK